MKRFIALLAPLFLLASCAGYHIGGIKPSSLKSVKNITVPMVVNETLHPRAESLASTAITRAVVNDGTYRITKVDKADAILRCTLSAINYTPVRSNRFDTLRPVELTTSVGLSWNLIDARNPTKRLASGRASGSSQVFVSSNLQTARNNALPDAFAKAAASIVSQIANGY